MVGSPSARAALAASVALLCSGCFKSYVAVSFRPPPEAAAPAQVHASERLAQVRPGLKTVAVRAPAACLTDAPAGPGGGGVAARTRTILASRCAVFAGELERALSTRFQVVPWRTLAEAEQERGLVHLAAQKVSADAVLEITELAPAPVLVTDVAGPGVLLQAANPDASPRGPARLSKKSERTIRGLVAARFPDGGVAGVAVQLEARLVSGAGEPLWSYRRRVAEDLEGALDVKLLVRGRGGTWRPVVPRGYRSPRPSAAGAAAADPVQERLRAIAQGLAQDVVARLSTAE